ncbi:hypothetical protein LTR17_003328 [Elasticomyces elasticus]|nr:hypothetical protein LTR17_003328 [Elasticomyces elasticus]
MSRLLTYVTLLFVLYFTFRYVYSGDQHNKQQTSTTSVAITTTILCPDASFTTWLDYHLQRAKYIMVHMDDPENTRETLEQICSTRPNVILLNGSQTRPEMTPESRIMLRQHDNVLEAIMYFLDPAHPAAWLVHIDTDELLYEPGGETERSWNRHQEAGSIKFTNHEALPLMEEVDDPFVSCTTFRVHSGGTKHFMAYGNGKAAVRLSNRVAPFGPHAFTGYRGELYKVPAEEAMVLHYPTPSYERWVAKYKHFGQFGDYWYSDPTVPNKMDFMKKSRDVVQAAVKSGDWTEARAFWDSWVPKDGTSGWREDVENDRVRKYEPLAGMLGVKAQDHSDL